MNPTAVPYRPAATRPADFPRRVLQTRDGQLADTALAQVTPANIPFISLRHGLPTALLAAQASSNDSVAAVRAALAPAQLTIDLTRQRILAAGREVVLPPAELALLAVFARKTLHGKEPLSAHTQRRTRSRLGNRYLGECQRITGTRAGSQLFLAAIREERRAGLMPQDQST